MTHSKRRLILRAALLVFILFSIPYFFLMAITTTREFKTFAQQKASEFLGAPVKIGKIRAGFLGDITLSHFEIAGANARPGLEIGKIIFRYEITQLLSRNFKIPATIVIQSPRMRMNQEAPFSFFQDIHVTSQPQGALSELELAGGEVHYAVPFLRSEIVLKKIEATFRPKSEQKWTGTFRAETQGLVESNITMKGEMDFKTGERYLRGEILNGKVSEFLIPQNNSFLCQFEIKDEKFFLRSLIFKSKSGRGRITGTVDHFLNQPRAEFLIETKSGSEKTRHEIIADLKQELLKGDLKTSHWNLTYSSAFRRDKNKLIVTDWKSNWGDTADASLDFDTRELNVRYSKDPKRLQIALRLEDQNLKGAARTDHFDFAGIDLVSSINFELMRDLKASSKTLRLEGDFDTDYFILDTVALDDLSGQFKLTSEGFSDLKASWGEGFKASGSIGFKNPLQSNLTVYLSNLNVNGFKRFASKPLPKDMGGTLNGRIKIEGSALRPHVVGYLTLREGWFGKVDFETAQIQFSGLAPVFDLKESHVYRGRGSLRITGKVDLSAQNILSGIQFETQDHIVLYRGLDVTLAGKDGDLDMEVHPGVQHLPAFGIRAGSSTPKKDRDQEESSREKVFQVGPRFRF